MRSGKNIILWLSLCLSKKKYVNLYNIIYTIQIGILMLGSDWAAYENRKNTVRSSKTSRNLE